MAVPNLLIVAIPILLYGVYLFYSRLVKWNHHGTIARQNGCKPAPSYPHKDPIFGLDLLYDTIKALKRDALLDGISKRFELAGSTHTALRMSSRLLFTIEPENVKAILSSNFKDYGLAPRRKKILSRYFGSSIFSSDGPAWEQSRAMLRPNFSRSLVEDLPVLEKHVANLIARIPRDGQMIDLYELFPRLTMDSASELLFGESTQSLLWNADERSKRFADAFNYVGEKMANELRLGSLAFFFPDAKMKADAEYINSFIDRYVAKAVAFSEGLKSKAEEEGRYVFLHELVRSGYGPEKIRVELLSILVAGRDTTASLLTILWYILARRPDIVRNLREEISYLGNKPPSLAQLKDLKYLKWTINETLRLYPIAPLNGRCAVADTILPLGGGPDGKSPVFVPAGTHVVFVVNAMHRRKDLFGDDAEVFRPERWESMKSGWHYLPFSGGPRICIGQQYALTEASYTTVRLLQAFEDIQPRDDKKWAERLTLILSSKHGCKVSLRRNHKEK